jgi:nucleotide-binding universal stress UspA family protein
VTAPLLAFGDDGSPGADVAWLWINNHPWPGWRIESVTASEVVFPPAAVAEPPAEWTPPWGRHATRPDGLASLRFLYAPGDPRVVMGDRTDAQLIVVGSTAQSHLRGIWVGSTTDWLLLHPPAPFAVVRSAARVETVTVCVDGSPHAEAAVAAFLALPLAAAARAAVVAVEDRASGAAGGPGTPVEAGLATALAAFEQAGVPATAVPLQGKPTRAILEHLDEQRPQLVVLGTRGLTGLKRLRLGSTANAVVRAAACSSLLACAALEPGA